nr:immunoglobulin light chain junction region [Macaca mulatta]
CMQGTQLWTY